MIQKKALNLISLGQTKSDNIIQIITITNSFYLKIIDKWYS